MRRIWTLAAVAAIGALAATTALSQTPQRGGAEGPSGRATAANANAHGQAIFKEHCASCHDPAIERAPNRNQLAALWADNVIDALKKGVMQPMAAGLNDQDITDVAVYLTGRAPGETFDVAAEAQNKCAASNHFNPAGPSWNGWSPDAQNTRVAAQTTIGRADAPKLAVKWSFAYQGGRYGQPSIVGNRVFVTSSSGRAYALDKATGCVAWAFTAPAGIRVTASVGKLSSAPSGYAVYFGDFNRTVYALDANSGAQLWAVKVEDHPRAVLTGAPTLYRDTLYVPVSSWEETAASIDAYECCKFRGSVVAIDAKTGKVKWKAFTIPTEPAPFKTNAAGTRMYGPAGAAIWSSPTIDPRRNLVYVATGDSYTDVDETYSDAIEAFDLTTGEMKWHQQVTRDDAFLMGCYGNTPAPNCPTPVGPDHDFGSSVILKHLPNGKDVLLAGQKSGQVYAMDPDDGGKIIWQTRVGRGSALGGVEWGMAADDNNLYVGIADRGMPTLSAFRLTDGALMWQHRAPEPAKCSFEGRCGNGYSGPVTVANGVVYGVNQDGHIRAYDAKTGDLVWDFDNAAQKYDTVNGVRGQHGGNLDATGITFAGSMGFLMAGFNGASGSSGPDNVLLAFSVGGK